MCLYKNKAVLGLHFFLQSRSLNHCQNYCAYRDHQVLCSLSVVKCASQCTKKYCGHQHEYKAEWTSGLKKAFSPRELQVTGYYLLFWTLSANSRDASVGKSQ